MARNALLARTVRELLYVCKGTLPCPMSHRSLLSASTGVDHCSVCDTDALFAGAVDAAVGNAGDLTHGEVGAMPA